MNKSLKFCKCGCGQEIKWKKYYSYYGIPDYISGHSGKGKKSPFEGRNHTEESKRKISIKCKGQKRSKETKIKISIANIGKSLTEDIKKKISEAHKGLRQTDEHKKKISESVKGKNHYNWKGGISFLPYCKRFNKNLKNIIRNRDSYQCQNPNCLITQLESIIIYDCKLHIHHIHYDKENCYPDLITLCHKHNSMANHNREYYEQLYMEVLKDRNLLNWKSGE